jgi:hypothetical protein
MVLQFFYRFSGNSVRFPPGKEEGQGLGITSPAEMPARRMINKIPVRDS